MGKLINFFSRVVLTLLLCTGVLLTSCGTNDSLSSETANCYIVSDPGIYKFKTVKGNSSISVGAVARAEVLWESFGTDVQPEVGDLIKSVSHSDSYIVFQTADIFKEGNAIIAAKDADGVILWSWHIWFTDQPEEHVYKRKAGIMMDRNLGATSTDKNFLDLRAYGLFYQWGRKDPFLGPSSIYSDAMAKSTITWPSTVESDFSNGTIEYATSHPTTFITCNYSNHDWYYTGSSSTDNTRWTTSDKAKSIYDPCPVGWRVPDGGSDGVWSKALGSSSSLQWRSENKLSSWFVKPDYASPIWKYPASGYRADDGSLYYVGYDGIYWSASYTDYDGDAYALWVQDYNFLDPLSTYHRAYGLSVRCVKE